MSSVDMDFGNKVPAGAGMAVNAAAAARNYVVKPRLGLLVIPNFLPPLSSCI